jgi:hypothetical protein
VELRPLSEDRRRGPVGLLALVQGAYFLLTGIWPILHRPSFEAVTGPKTDFWLVRTVGSLIAVIGAVLVLTGLRDKSTAETVTLGAGSAAALLAVDVNYVARGRISPVYLLDAALEVALLLLWGLATLLPARSMRIQHSIETEAPEFLPTA